MSDAAQTLIAGRYQLVELIGRGGMAEVWRGHDHRRDLPVAVKIVNPMAGGVAAAERFAREARAAAQVVHPNVVTVLDVGQDGERRFIVMELLTGRSLAAELAARGRLPVAEVCALLAQAAAGLQAAHQAGVAHRDVKPANLHLTRGGTLKVVDFGLAHLAGEAARLTAVGTIMGTAAYLAPEQIDGSGGTPAGDLYGLGCVAYELLCGQPPFTGSAPELVYRHVHQAPAPPSAHRPDIPVELERLILAMLAKNPAERPPNADHVRRVLTAVANAAGTHRERGADVPVPGTARAGDTAVLSAPPPDAPRPAGGRPGSSSQGRTLLVQVGVALAAFVAVTLVVMGVFSGSGNPVAAPVPSASDTREPEPREQDPREPEPSAGAASPRVPSPRPDPTRVSAPAAAPLRPGSQGPGTRDPRAWLLALERAVNVQESFGDMEPGLAHRAREKIRKASEKLAEGKVREARKKIQELGRDLAKARRQGKLGDGPLTELLG